MKIYGFQSIIFRDVFYCSVIAIILLCADPSSAQSRHTVRWVSDGDTIVLDNGRRVRYIGINAPEIDHEDRKAQPFGYRAKAFNKKLVAAQTVRIEYDADRRDRYGRDLAYVYLSDHTFVNVRMLEAGLAFYLYRKPNLKYGKRLHKAQQSAMTAGNGMWRNWGEKEKTYIGNRNSRRFHAPTCKFAQRIKSTNRIVFSSRWAAFYQGYAPSKICIAEYWSDGTGN